MASQRIRECLDGLIEEIERLQRPAEPLPRTTADVEAMVVELAAAHVDIAAHCKCWPNPLLLDAETDKYTWISPEAQESWSRALDRRDAAVARLAEYGARLAEVHADAVSHTHSPLALIRATPEHARETAAALRGELAANEAADRETA